MSPEIEVLNTEYERPVLQQTGHRWLAIEL
jgi:hypothetical protein